VQEVNEWRLLHGSSQEACAEICERNFNLDLAGSGATWKKDSEKKGTSLYGAGIYFSERITKADEYAEPLAKAAPGGDTSSGGLCTVLICRVLGGRGNICTQNEIDADALRQLVFAGPHHSVIGDRVTKLGKPYREFVVYDRDQVFPEYLLTYVRLFPGK